MSEEGWRGWVGRLNEAEVTAFLAEPQLARLACLDDEGWPYVVPCWQEWDGDSFWVIPDDTRAFASIPSRHDAWRRVTRDWLTGMVVTGIVGEDAAAEMAHEVAHGLALQAVCLPREPAARTTDRP